MLRFSRRLSELNWFATQLPSFYPNSVHLLCLILRDDYWRRWWHPTPVLLPRKSHGRRSLVGCSPWGHKEVDTTERLHFHFLLSCIGEGNGNPLQCSCLENSRDGGTWWAAIYGVAWSQTWLKWRSSSSSSSKGWLYIYIYIFFFLIQVLLVLQEMLVKLTSIFFNLLAFLSQNIF